MSAPALFFVKRISLRGGCAAVAIRYSSVVDSDRSSPLQPNAGFLRHCKNVGRGLGPAAQESAPVTAGVNPRPTKRKNRKHITTLLWSRMCFLVSFLRVGDGFPVPNFFNSKVRELPSYFRLSSTATATLTVIPTMGLLPAPRKPIISTWAGTEEEPANWASPCIRPMVSVMP